MNNHEVSPELLKLEEYGVNIQAALDRFMGKELIYKKCLLKLIDDSTMEKLNNAMNENDVKEADNAAHTLAGIVGNLSLDSLHSSILTLRNQLHDEKIDMEQLNIIKELYNSIIEVIKSIA